MEVAKSILVSMASSLFSVEIPQFTSYLNNLYNYFSINVRFSYNRFSHRPALLSCRLDKANMTSVQNFTLLWRMTCSFATNGIDYRDYVRGKKQELDVIHFGGSKVCKTVEYVNVRGHSCSQCTANFYQPVGTNLHIDSDTNCDFDSTSGAVFSEDNFGVYDNANFAFRCTESLESTTQVWFGDYI